MFLHAWHLSFHHPSNKQVVPLLAELPGELQLWVASSSQKVT
jgi:hypothetical protein